MEFGPVFLPEVDAIDSSPGVAINGLAEAVRRKPLTPVLIEELDFLSRGFSIQERGAYGVGFEAARSRRKIAKRNLGAKSMHHAVVMAIQEGHISIEASLDSPDFQLTAMENAAIRLAALGWSSDQIAENYRKSPDTVRRYYEDAREKFGVKTLSHLMRRAFENGMFEIGEPIEYPKDINQAEWNLLQIQLGESTETAKDLGLTHPHELEVLSLLPDLQAGVFVRSDMYKLGFYEDAYTPSARAQAYGRAIASISRKLEKIYGEPIIENVGQKNRVYAIRQSLLLGPPENIRPTPVFNGEYMPPGLKKPQKAPRLKLVREEKLPEKKETKESKPIVARKSPAKTVGIKVFAD